MADEDLLVKPRPTPHPPKVADRPHNWTVRLAIAAAVISFSSATFSGLQWWESHKERQKPANYKLAEGAILAVETAEFVSPVRPGSEVLRLHVRNIGRTSALHIVVKKGEPHKSGRFQPCIEDPALQCEVVVIEPDSNSTPALSLPVLADRESFVCEITRSSVRFPFLSVMQYEDVFGGKHEYRYTANLWDGALRSFHEYPQVTH